jgi:Predicted Zn-dependent peptidases
MAELKTYSISGGVNLHTFIEDDFKTMRVSVNMFVPLLNETAAANAILPSLISRATREYPDYTKLGERLSELYGASLDSRVSKLGAFQIITVSAEGIADKYAFGGEDMLKMLSDMLFSILFTPLTDKNGLLPEDGFELEKRQILEIFDSEFNDKIHYARRRAGEILFGDAPEGINRYGAKEDVQKLSCEEVSAQLKNLLSEAKYEIFVTGACNPDIAYFEKTFAGMGKNLSLKRKAYTAGDVKEVTEEMQLSQSKLVMGYRTNIKPEEKLAYTMMAVVLGGTPSSKFFANVREKMGLCYYCSAGFESVNAVLAIESGIETENIEKTKKAVFAQMEDMKKGNITEDEIMSAKLAVCNSYKSVTDSLGAIENWYLMRTFEENADTPQKAAEKIMAITKEDIVKAANSFHLDTVYVLKGVNE